MDMTGLIGYELNVFLANFVAHTAVALAAYVLFGGLPTGARMDAQSYPENRPEPFTRTHWFTMAILSIWIIGVVVFRLNPGVTAFGTAATLLIIGRATDNSSAIASVPWGIILMVSGVSVLIGVMDEIGGSRPLYRAIWRGLPHPGSANGVMAFVTGIISTYSSTSGVVYPGLPTHGTGSGGTARRRGSRSKYGAQH